MGILEEFPCSLLSALLTLLSSDGFNRGGPDTLRIYRLKFCEKMVSFKSDPRSATDDVWYLIACLISETMKHRCTLLVLLSSAVSHSTARQPWMAMSTHIRSGRIVHLNHAGASPSPTRVTSCLANHYAAEQVLGGYQAAADAQHRLDEVYQKAATLIDAKSSSEIALVESATVGWTRLFYSFCAAKQSEGPAALDRQQKKQLHVILISEAEYAANVVAACQWAEDREDWIVLAIPSKVDSEGRSTGKVDLEVLKQMLGGSFHLNDGSLLDPSTICLVCITHVPTNSGIVNPAQDIGDLIDRYNTDRSVDSQSLPPILFLLDSCQSIGQMVVKVSEIKCHGLVATGRKFLRGPRGTGFLYLSESIGDKILPHHVDHYGMPVQKVPARSDVMTVGRPVNDFMEWKPLPSAKRFEFWESNIAGRLALGQTLQEVLDRGIHTIETCIQDRAVVLYNALREIPQVKLYYKPECGICSFSVTTNSESSAGITAPAVDPLWIKSQLWQVDPTTGLQYDISVSPATSTPLDSARTGAPNLIRVSVSYTNTNEDIHSFCERLGSILDIHGQSESI